MKKLRFENITITSIPTAVEGSGAVGKFILKTHEIAFSSFANVERYSAAVQSVSAAVGGTSIGASDVIALGYGVDVIGLSYGSASINVVVRPWVVLATGHRAAGDNIENRGWGIVEMRITGLMYGS